MFFKGKWLVIAASLLLVPVAAQDATQESTVEPMLLSDEITFESPVAGLSPEGIEWDATRGRFLVGSLSQGTIYSVTPNDDGTAVIEPLIEDEALVTTVGLELDKENDRLLVSNSDRTAFAGGPGGAGLAAYDLETGEQVYLVDFASVYESDNNFANDVTVDDEGNAYVTNSFAPVLYKVTPEGEASVLIEDESLGADFLGTNGIVFHPDGYLLVTNSGTQSLLKVTLGDEVTITPVELDVPFGADGMILAEDGTLYGVSNQGEQQVIVAVVSDDDWSTASVTTVGETTGAATTIALAGGVPYYINAYLNDAERTEYQIIGVAEMMPQG
jgi:sugar lactone lactonase YvrE